MRARVKWIAYAAAGLLLLAVGAVIVTWHVGNYASSVRKAFRDSCRRQATTLEVFAEDWIVRDQLDGLRGALTLLLMGDGLYADVIFRGENLLSLQDTGLDRAPSPLDATEPPPDATTVRDLSGGSIEVRTPIILEGYPGIPAGMLRLAYSGDYANAQIHRFLLRTAGLALAAWSGLMALAGLVVWRFGQGATAIEEGSVAHAGALAIDLQTCRATLGRHELSLTPKLYELLLLFVQRQGEILSDQDLLDAIWRDSPYAASPDVKQHIYLLRRALGEIHSDPKQVIVNVKGFGYRLDPPSIEDLKAD
jgi:DNA-binding winged helix-turn-helix (wHTH) protein